MFNSMFGSLLPGILVSGLWLCGAVGNLDRLPVFPSLRREGSMWDDSHTVTVTTTTVHTHINRTVSHLFMMSMCVRE